MAAWCVLAWLGHAALTRLHEAAHGTLYRSAWWNDAAGIVIGTLSLTPLSVYRYMHHRHHAQLGRPGDPEFWPYNQPGTARGVRLVYAWLELAVGWLFTPALYSLRTARSWTRINPGQRSRLVAEWMLLLVVWTGILVMAWRGGWWWALCAVYAGPAWLTGSMQTIRKFTEHLGLFGDSIFAMTRVVVYRGLVGRVASRSQLHVEHHAAHHRWARIPFYDLPRATDAIHGGVVEGPIFPNHLRAVMDMAPHLLDPKLGPAWLTRGGGGRSAGG